MNPEKMSLFLLKQENPCSSSKVKENTSVRNGFALEIGSRNSWPTRLAIPKGRTALEKKNACVSPSGQIKEPT